MQYKFITFLLGLCLLSSCAMRKNTEGEQQQVETSQEDSGVEIVHLAEGEEKLLSQYPLQIKFIDITEDSRCPEGTNCIWAGVAVARIEVTAAKKKTAQVQLASTAMPSKNHHQSAEINGFTIKLEKVAPYPQAEDESKALKGKYKIAIAVSKKI